VIIAWMRHVVIACAALVAACGRLGFDPTSDAAMRDGAPRDVTRATPALVQANGCDANDAPVVSCSFAGNVQAGDTIIVALDYRDQAIQLTELTDSLGNAYTIAVGPYDGSGIREYLAWAPVLASGPDTVSFRVGGAVNFEMRLHELSGIAAFDGLSEASGSGMGAFTYSSPPVTTTAPGDLLFALALQVGPPIQTAPPYDVALAFDGDLSELAIAGAPGPYTASAFTPDDAMWTIVLMAFRAATQ
jgi:hypothetical protein